MVGIDVGDGQFLRSPPPEGEYRDVQPGQRFLYLRTPPISGENQAIEPHFTCLFGEIKEFLFVSVQVAEKQLVSHLTEFCFYAIGALGEIRILDVRDGQPDYVGVLVRNVAGKGVWYIIHLLHGFQNMAVQPFGLVNCEAVYRMGVPIGVWILFFTASLVRFLKA